MQARGGWWTQATGKEKHWGKRGVPEAPPALPTFAGLPVGDGLAQVAVVALLAVVAVAAGRVVAAVEADAPALAPRQLVELHVEAAAPGMQVAAAGCGGGRESVRKGHLGGGVETAPESPPPPQSFSQIPPFPLHTLMDHLAGPDPRGDFISHGTGPSYTLRVGRRPPVPRSAC